MNRRALIAGAVCVGAAALAQAARPHRYVSLLQSAKLDDIVPRSFGAWTSEDVGDPLALNAPGTLSAKLYNQMITRAYSDGRGPRILMLLAHGERQSDELQLHRPEVCYPAFGYQVAQNQYTQLALGGPVLLPARQLLAQAPGDDERVVYWTRLGEYFPTSSAEQRKARFQNTLAGVIPDGVLCRFSVADTTQNWDGLKQFLHELVGATGPQGRRVLIGTERSVQLTQHA